MDPAKPGLSGLFVGKKLLRGRKNPEHCKKESSEFVAQCSTVTDAELQRVFKLYQPKLDSIIESILKNTVWLYQSAGARKFLVLSVPDLSKTPWTLGYSLSQQADLLIGYVNKKLRASVLELAKNPKKVAKKYASDLPGDQTSVSLQWLDIGAAWTHSLQYRNEYGIPAKFQEFTSCRWDQRAGKLLPKESFCDYNLDPKDPSISNYAYFDGNHPTAPAQYLIGHFAAMLVKSEQFELNFKSIRPGTLPQIKKFFRQ